MSNNLRTLRERILRRNSFFRFSDHLPFNNVYESIVAMLLVAKRTRHPVATVFNDIYFVVRPEMDYTEARAAWDSALADDHARYVKSYRAGLAKRRQQQYQRELVAREERVKTLMATDSIEIRRGKKRAYKKMVALNSSDGYSKAVVTYACAWAVLMQEAMRSGSTLEDIAEQLSHEADFEGITGFQYGVAVSMLAEFWIYGERLRRWSNLRLQIHNEGELANKKGGVLNPALLTTVPPQ